VKGLSGERGGQGAAQRRLGEATVFALVVVNALGAVVDRQGQVLRGHLDERSSERRMLHDWAAKDAVGTQGNTTLTAVVTNQRMEPYALRQLTRQVHASMARAIQPFHTPFDGDVLFAATTAEVDEPTAQAPSVLGALASETVWDAVLTATAENYVGLRGFQPGDTIAGVNYSMGYRDTTVEYGDVQLVGSFDALGQRHDVVVGATRQKTTFDSYYAYGGLLGNVDINNIGAATYVTPNFNLVLNPFSRTSNVLVSYYAEATLRPVDRLTIVAGVRHDDFEVTNRVSRVKTPTDDVTVRVGGSFELLEGFNAYASYAESFIPQNGLMRNGNVIDPETATNYEVGVKGALLDNRVNVTAAMFWLTRQNVATADPANVPGQPAYVVPTGEQEHNGYEVNVRFAPNPAIRLRLATAMSMRASPR
jgi:outer membrane receptor protein involved in Fe transport